MLRAPVSLIKSYNSVKIGAHIKVLGVKYNKLSSNAGCCTDYLNGQKYLVENIGC